MENIETKNYHEQVKEDWPKEGRHILAQYDSKSIIVYQAFKPSIAEYAVQHQKFGGPDYSTNRVTWVKINFLRMMFRSGWASKPGQECILAIRLKLSFFINTLLANSVSTTRETNSTSTTGETKSSTSTTSSTGTNKLIRRQWDPDHLPSGEPYKERRAIQLGIKGYFQEFNENILEIHDITKFVKDTKVKLDTENKSVLSVPKEKVLFEEIPEVIRNNIF